MKTATRKKQQRKPKPRKKSPSATKRRDLLTFPEVKGKTIAELKLYLRNDDTCLSIFFADKTEGIAEIAVIADIADIGRTKHRGSVRELSFGRRPQRTSGRASAPAETRSVPSHCLRRPKD